MLMEAKWIRLHVHFFSHLQKNPSLRNLFSNSYILKKGNCIWSNPRVPCRSGEELGVVLAGRKSFAWMEET